MRTRCRALTVGLFAMMAMLATGSVAFATNPAPEILSPHTNQSVTTGPLTVIGISEESVLVEVWEDSQVVGSGFADDAGIFQVPVNLGGFGTHTIKARELGADLTYSPFSPVVTFSTDFAPAIPEFKSPAPNARLKTTSVVVAGHADNNATVTLKEGLVTRASGLPVSSRLWSNTLTFSEGTHTLTATATDPKGRVSAGSTVTFVIDTTPPAAPVIMSPAAGSYSSSTSVPVSGTAEASSTVTVYEGATTKGTTLANTSGSWSISLTFAAGSHSITARATDLAGNQGAASPARAFVVDTTPPAVTFTTPDNSVFLPGAATLQGAASDNRNVARVELRYITVTGSDVKTVNASCAGCGTTTATWSDPEPSFGAGVYKVSATAVDAAGNRSAPVTITFLVV